MKTEQNNLDRLKGKNPFTVPEGYMEGLTANIMSQLPEREPEEEVKKVSLMDRVRPWLYMAAVFAGLGLFFKVLVGPDPAKIWPQLADASPLKPAIVEKGIDFIVVRELIGGVYFGEPRTYEENGEKVAVDTMPYSEHEIERIGRIGFETASTRRCV